MWIETGLVSALKEKGLSSREAEVAAWVARGETNKVVANALFVTEKTVKFHLTNVFKKLGLRSRSQLIVWAMPYKLNFVEKPAQATETAPLPKPAPIDHNTVKLPFSGSGNA